jgi:sortase (surface protein transpeptidase)
VASPGPVALRASAIGLDAAVVAVGVEPDNTMTIPTDVADVGWYRHGPSPGAAGSAVLAGHVDSRTQGRGAFFGLTRLDVGDRLAVDYDDGSSVEFEVVGRRSYDKDVVPLDEVFARDGEPRLSLITCGGRFDAETGHYRDNVVVYAVPV